MDIVSHLIVIREQKKTMTAHNIILSHRLYLYRRHDASCNRNYERIKPILY